MDSGGSPTRQLQVAIVGSGPSGFYAAEALLQSGHEVEVSLIDRLAAPFGLVRYGVAPDHPKLKQPTVLYDGILQSPRVLFFGNIRVGKDVKVQQLLALYHAVIFAYGAEADRALGIPGETLPGSNTATEFVGWYNGHPDYRDREFDLSQESVAVIGNGNVAIDVARILAKTVDELKHTDIADHALSVLAESKVRDIHIIGRRGPAQARFTSQELQEFGKLVDCDAHIDRCYLKLNPASENEVADKMSRGIAKNVQILGGFTESGPSHKRRRCHFHFLQSPLAFIGNSRVSGLRLAKNRLHGDAFEQIVEETSDIVELTCGLVFRAIGYRGVPIEGLPFDHKRGVLRTLGPRLVTEEGDVIPGLYATGWIKRGPSGTIGTNRADSTDTVTALLDDLHALPGTERRGAADFARMLRDAGKVFVSYADWRKIDLAETQAGQMIGKPREKITRMAEMLALTGAPGIDTARGNIVAYPST